MATKTEVIVKCLDNCTALSIDKWDDAPEYFITLYSSFNRKTTFIQKLKFIFKILMGKKIYHYDIVLSEEDFNKIKNFK